MQFIYFTKFWPDASAQKLAQQAKRMGAEGLDLCIRQGHLVNPDNVTTAFPEAMKVWQCEGISVPMVTTEPYFTDPKHPTVEPILSTCQKLGVTRLKLGYYQYRDGMDYWREVDRIRWHLEGFERLGERYDVCICYHTHSGGCFGSNCGNLMHLIKGFNPRWIGAYVDTGHMWINGETWPMGIDMVRDYLRMIGMKSPAWLSKPEGDHTRWYWRLMPFKEAAVDVHLVFKTLLRVGFDGPLSFHGEFEGMSPDQRVEANREDIAYCRRVLAEVSGK